jgi:hypothetical protein
MAEIRDAVLISYSHLDREWLQRLRTHLEPVANKNNIPLWDDTGMN